MDTTSENTIPVNENEQNEQTPKGNKEGLKTAGIAAGAAVAGAGATMAANHFITPEAEVTDADVATAAEATPAAESAANTTTNHTQEHPKAPEHPSQKGAVNEHSTPEHHEEQHSGQQGEQQHNQQPPVQNQNNEQPPVQNQNNEQPPVEHPENEQPRPINPDENIPEIAEEEIDPTDYDGKAYVEFGEVAKVYNVDGSETTTATAVTADGQEMVMIDIDGDEIFDAIADNTGTIVSEDTGGMTVGDAEVQIDNGPDMAYIEPTENDMPMPEGEDFMNDIVDA